MNSISSGKWISSLLVVVLLGHLIFLPTPASGQDRVVVTVGKPNIWSLEQAHYLLARIRERNLGIRNPALTEIDLDPNAIGGTRLEAFRSLFEAGVSYTQGIGTTNQINRQNLEFNQLRRQELFGRRSALFDQKNHLLGEVGRLTGERQTLETGGASEEVLKQKDGEVKAIQVQITAVDSQLANVDKEIAVVGTGSDVLTNPAAQAGPGSFSNGMGDRIAKAITDEFAKSGARNPRLAASVKLDNYIQMQYELLAKQLTLLRDEVGPNERLVFLELPTSIYATPDRGDEMTAQSWWKVTGFYRENKFAARLDRLERQKQSLTGQLTKQLIGRTPAERSLLRSAYSRDLRELNEEIAQIRQEFYEDSADAMRRGGRTFTSPEDVGGGLLPNDVSTRSIDLIPRQSSLNVSDLKEVVKERGFKALFSLLIGIGGSVNYQQRREQFEQFQQQEVYAAGFGKGSTVFGWTFAPMPGTKRLAPGVRTTYAVMVVPRDATKIQLKAQGRSFRSSRDQTTPTFTELGTETIDLDIPSGTDEGFFVSRIDYPTVAVNHRSVVVLRGDFSNQTGVLVNGTALARTVGVASPWLGSEKESANPSLALGEPDTSVKGYFEVINANHIILVFLMPKDFKGTPQITMVSPGRARALNDLTLNVNGVRTRLQDYNQGYMIGSKAPDPKTPLAIDNVEVSPVRPPVRPPGTPALVNINAKVNLTVSGIKTAAPSPIVYFNANPQNPTLLGESLYNFEVSLPLNLEKVTFTIVQGKESDTFQIDNPVFAKVVVSKIIYDFGDEDDPEDDSATIAIEGRRIEDLNITANCTVEVQGRSFNQGVVRISNLAKQNIVSLTDSLTGEAVAPIIVNRRPPKKSKSNGNNSGSGKNESDNK